MANGHTPTEEGLPSYFNEVEGEESEEEDYTPNGPQSEVKVPCLTYKSRKQSLPDKIIEASKTDDLEDFKKLLQIYRYIRGQTYI